MVGKTKEGAAFYYAQAVTPECNNVASSPSYPFKSSSVPQQTVSLRHHPTKSCPATERVEVKIARTKENGVTLTYHLHGQIDHLAIPGPQEPGATDGLWQHTCFEAFIAPAGATSYREFNFSPSGKWAHYAFSGYRQREELPHQLPAPEISVCHFPEYLELQVTLEASLLPSTDEATFLQIGLSAVIESADGNRSFWAMSHPGPVPDFHDRSTFLLKLPVPK